MIRWHMRKLPNGEFEGMITLVPTQTIPGAAYGMPGKLTKGKPVKLVAQSASKAGALAKASSVADQLLNNPIVAAALPPGSGQAVKAIKYLSKAANAGKLASAAKNVVGNGAKRLASALKFW